MLTLKVNDTMILVSNSLNFKNLQFSHSIRKKTKSWEKN
jgi:hypothetical protein